MLIETYKSKLGRTCYLYQCGCGTQKKSRKPLDKLYKCLRCYIDSMTPDMVGKTFGQWTVLKYSHYNGSSKQYLCRCSCGIEAIRDGSALRRGKTVRCNDCRKKWLKDSGHGMKKTSIWVIWMGIKARCLNSKNRAYKNYGGRGITIDPRWHSFLNFYEDMGDRPNGMQIDRIDNDKGYYKENCRWATPKENCNNRRNSKLNGKTN